MPTVVSAISQIIVAIGTVLEVCLVWRVLRARLVSKYPYFSFYVFCLLLRTFSLYLVQLYGIHRIPADLYASYYWNTESVGVALRCLIVWEVFRYAFPSGSPLSKIASKGFAAIAFGLFIFAVGALASLWGFHSYATLRSVHPALDRSFGFAQSVFILSILLATKSFGIPLGRNIWGMGVGLGAWISLSTLNNAIIDLTHSFYPYMQVLRPLGFVGLLAVWTWALWEVSPSTSVADHAATPAEIDIWTENWNRTQGSLRRVKPS
jgi:hypothetical protein